MLQQLQMNRQILFEFTSNYLEPLRGAFQRLAYLSSLREPAGERYVHERLAAVYGPEPVHQVLSRCHEEIFERLLEMPLDLQETELRGYVSALQGAFPDNLETCAQTARTWIPPQAPSYLTELYRSNLSALVELLQDELTRARSNR